MRLHTRAALVLAPVLIGALLLPLSAHAQAQVPAEISAPEPHWGLKAFDAAVLRPMGFAALAVGAGLFVPAAVLVAPSGKENLETALETFVLEPYAATFRRPLGKLN